MSAPPPKTQISHISLKGDRKNNQDRCLALEAPHATLLLLGDGLGGHPRGEDAAEMFIRVGERLFRDQRRAIAHPPQFLEEMFKHAHRSILAFGQAQHPPIAPRTTAVAVLIQDDMAHWAHSGDSRVYLIRDGQPYQRTQDHTSVERMRLRGVFDDEREAPQAPGRNAVYSCLGGNPEVTEISLGQPTRLRDGDVLLLCSDGVWDHHSDDSLAQQMSLPESLRLRLGQVVQQAVERGYPRADNATALALEWHPATSAKPAADEGGDGDQLDAALSHLQQIIDKYQ